jgi:peptidoglycan/LPS O-acetylase OafA/YrhL
MFETVKPLARSTRFYGIGIVAIAAVNLALGAVDPTQSIPENFPGRVALTYGTSAFLLLAGAGILWRRAVAWSAAALVAYYAVIVALLMNGPTVLGQPTQYGAYFGTAEAFAIAAAGLIILTANGKFNRETARRLIPTARGSDSGGFPKA